MIRRVFLDSDVILDIALAREPFVEHSSLVLAILEQKRCAGVVSSNVLTNVYYVLQKLSSSQQARDFIRDLLQIIEVVSVNHNAVIQGLDSDFADLEDGIQHFAALEARCDCIVTRNGADYAKAQISVFSPREFVTLFKPLTA
jgi:predicted nucleic acid-binding protein